ncbi:hypothetical protein GALMADRAFT_248258 [Galerina marginata CBS 339.88]|uniref:Uncharacterized protein n=1 Tax=Galerina marginata (strain CBS 339.88) TaxID=685588 RepID=A0A067T9H8_GALM3|nr:hypothetical protein GALMADRAFT_248258 [Galerina marginata CBS 339.88]
MLSLVLRASRCAAPRRSLFLHQQLLVTYGTRLASTDAAPVEDTAPQPPGKPRPPPNLRTAYIRTWQPLANIADAYAMIRVLERKYGKVIEAHFLKDFEVPMNYQNISWIVFKDPKSVQRIPERGFDFTIPAAGVQKEPHEIGMEDIEHLAQEGDYEEGFELAVVDPETNQRVIGGRIVRSEQDFIGEGVDSRLYQPTAGPVLRSFLRWGGFSKLTPIDSKIQIKEEDLFADTPGAETEPRLDSIRMRAALQVAAFATNSQNPAVINEEPAVSATKSTRMNTGPSRRTSDTRQVDWREGGELSFGQMVFGTKSPIRDSPEALKTSPSGSESIPLSSTSPSASPATSNLNPLSTPSTPSESPFSSISAFPDTPPPTARPKAPPTAAQIASKQALERQLEVARQLREQVVAPRRKQAKPALSSNSRTARKGAPREMEFFDEDVVKRGKGDEPDVRAKEPTKPGVLTRLWGMFGRK